MRITLLAPPMDAALGSELDAAGLEVRTCELPAGDGEEPGGELSACLRASERALSGHSPDAAVVAGGGDAALAAALTAVKLQLPTVWVSAAGEEPGSLVERVADLTVPASEGAQQIATAVRELVAPTIEAG